MKKKIVKPYNYPSLHFSNDELKKTKNTQKQKQKNKVNKNEDSSCIDYRGTFCYARIIKKHPFNWRENKKKSNRINHYFQSIRILKNDDNSNNKT